jgi:hypothetical protein
MKNNLPTNRQWRAVYEKLGLEIGLDLGDLDLGKLVAQGRQKVEAVRVRVRGRVRLGVGSPLRVRVRVSQPFRVRGS